MDGADWLSNLLDGRPETYVAHAEDYYERTVSLSIVSHVFSQRRLTAQVAVALNPEADIELVSEKLGSSDTRPTRKCRYSLEFRETGHSEARPFDVVRCALCGSAPNESEAMGRARRLVCGAMHPLDDARGHVAELPDAPEGASQLLVEGSITFYSFNSGTPVVSENRPRSARRPPWR